MKFIILILTLITSLYLKGQVKTHIDTSSFYSIVNNLDINDKTIVLIGEAHGVSSTYNTELLIIESFIEKGFRTIYIEGGKSEATIINMFLESGDTNLLKHTRAREEDGGYKFFIKSLYTIHNKNKITVTGLDFERPACVGFLLSKWFQNTIIGDINFDSLSNTVQSFDKVNEIGLKESKNNIGKMKIVFDRLKKSLDENEMRYKEILGPNFQVFHQIIHSNLETNEKERNLNFTKTILNDKKIETPNNAIVIVGSDHLVLKNSFGPLLMETIPNLSKIHSFIFIYKNCDQIRYNQKYNSSKYLLKHLTISNTEKPLIKFSIAEKNLIPTYKNNITIITELHNQ